MDEGQKGRVDEGRAVNVMAISVTVFVAGVCLYVGRFVLVPLVIAFFLCKITQPLVEFLRARRVPWWISVTGLMVVMSGFIVWGALVLAGRSFVFIESQRANFSATTLDTGSDGPASDSGAATQDGPPDRGDPVDWLPGAERPPEGGLSSGALMRWMNGAVGRAWTDFRSGGEDGARAISAFKTAAPLILTTANLFVAAPLTRVIQLVFANIPSTRSIAILMSNGTSRSVWPYPGPDRGPPPAPRTSFTAGS